MSAILRVKRKACDEPVDGLVVCSKKSKYDEISNTNEVYFKFAATLKNQSDPIKDHIQAALSKDKSSKFTKWRNPKNLAHGPKNALQVCEKLKNEFKAASEKKKLDHLNNRRLIFCDTVPIEEEEKNQENGESAEVRKLFQLYDIIEENEDVKKQVAKTGALNLLVMSEDSECEEGKSTITCNGEPLIREKSSEYVYDVFIADVLIDDSFTENMVSVRPCKVTDDDIYSGESEDSGEFYEDEDDSNDENNWRNEYPEDEESRSEQESDESFDAYDCVVNRSLKDCHLAEDDDDYVESYDGSKILKECNDDSEGSD